MSSATLEASTKTKSIKKSIKKPVEAGSLSCPHCHKAFRPNVDETQPPRLQGTKCPNCKLFVPARVVAAALSTH